MRDPLLLSRRGVLILAAAGFPARLFATAADFWNKKPPAEWTAEEIDRLLTDSPWAKPVTAEYSGETEAPSGGRGGAPPGSGGSGRSGGSGGSGPWGEGPPVGGRGGGISVGGIPGIGFPRLPSGRGNPQPRGRKGPSQYRGTVLWESAKLVQEALKTPLPDVFENHYAITVSGIPLLSPRGGDDDPKDDVESLKRFATLQPKGKPASEADIARREVSNGSVLAFGFRKDAPALGPDDKEILFEARFSGLLVKAKFNPKEMLYRGALAL
jgi:hypothetical protein